VCAFVCVPLDWVQHSLTSFPFHPPSPRGKHPHLSSASLHYTLQTLAFAAGHTISTTVDRVYEGHDYQAKHHPIVPPPPPPPGYPSLSALCLKPACQVTYIQSHPPRRLDHHHTQIGAYSRHPARCRGSSPRVCEAYPTYRTIYTHIYI